MKKVILFLVIFCSIIKAQETIPAENANPDTVLYSPPAQTTSNVFYGGNLSFVLWNNYFQIGVYPMVGLSLTEKLHAGVRVGYAYISDSRLEPSLDSHNYGAGLFAFYDVIRQIYLKSEFLYFSYERAYNITINNYSVERVGVPFLLLGAGYRQQVGNNMSVFAEVTFDVLMDENSPYEDWEPMISIGMGVGL